MTQAEQNQLLFLRWLATTSPALYNAYVTEAQPQTADAGEGLDGFMDIVKGIGTFAGKVLEVAPEIYSTYVGNKQQSDLIKVNLARAQQGQAPVTEQGTPVDPRTLISTLPTAPNGFLAPVGGVPMWVWLAGAGLLAILLLRK